MKANPSWEVGQLWFTSHNHLMRVKNVRADGIAEIEMVWPIKSRSHTQGPIPDSWYFLGMDKPQEDSEIKIRAFMNHVIYVMQWKNDESWKDAGEFKSKRQCVSWLNKLIKSHNHPTYKPKYRIVKRTTTDQVIRTITLRKSSLSHKNP